MKILHIDGSVLFEGDYPSIKACVEDAVRRGRSLSGANLRGAILRGADLRDAVFREADLSDANLSGADLREAVFREADLSGAILSGAILSGAILREADLREAVFRGADLRDAVFREADLRDANLSGADFRGANLREANLDGEILTKDPVQITGLRWDVLITPGFLRIGCQRHSHEQWGTFGDKEIDAMDSQALAWWKENKDFLLSACAAVRQ